MGLLNVQFSLATAAGLFKSVIRLYTDCHFLHRCIQSRRLQDFLRRDKKIMIQSKSLGSKIFNVFNIILMSLLSLSCLYPLWYTLFFLF